MVWLCPKSWHDYFVHLKFFEINIPGIIAIGISSIMATLNFKASLQAKPWRLFWRSKKVRDLE